MLRFSRSAAAPAKTKKRVADAASAKAWLAAMPQPGSIASLAEIAAVLNTLGALGEQNGSAGLHPQRKFAIAERVRGVVLPVLWDRAREDGYDALPIKEEQSQHFWPAVDAAIALRDVYAWLVSQLPDVIDSPDFALGKHDTQPAAPATMSRFDALQRALEVNSQIMLVIQRVRFPVPASMWERHCTLGQLVRDLDCQDNEIVDALRMSSTTTCRGAFVLPVMVALADSASRSVIEYDVMRMAAQRWAGKVGFRIDRRDAVAPLPRPVTNPGPTVTLGQYVLRFDTQSAMQSIDKRLAALADGKSAREVGISDALRPQAARDLLQSLRVRWGAVTPASIDSPDRSWRVLPEGVPMLGVVTMPSKAARLTATQTSLSSVSRAQDTYTYHKHSHGDVTKPRTMVESERIEHLLSGAEAWTLLATAPDALRCLRRHARPRIGLQRLVAVKLGDRDTDGRLMVGWTEALQSQSAEGEGGEWKHTDAHVVRMRLAPGLPLIVRAAADDAELDYAFLLMPRLPEETVAPPPVAPGSFLPMISDDFETSILDQDEGDSWNDVRKSPGEFSLMLPHSTYKPHRLLKVVRGGSLAVLRLEELTLRGGDFDLVRFTPL